jgi:hypothetical protein
MCNHEWETSTDQGSVCKLCKRTASECFEPTYKVLSFKFDSVDDAANFKAWLSDGGGEQSFNAGDEQYDLDYFQGDLITVKKMES